MISKVAFEKDELVINVFRDNTGRARRGNNVSDKGRSRKNTYRCRKIKPGQMDKSQQGYGTLRRDDCETIGDGC